MSIATFIQSILGDVSVTFIKKAKKIVAEVAAKEEVYQKYSQEELREKVAGMRAHLVEGGAGDAIVADAFAIVREVALRTLGLRHYDVQIIGGYAMYKGMIAEMRTGEGKTLVATLPVFLRALEGKGVHVVTVNDYLAKRDMVLMGQIYAYLGLSVSVITNQNASHMYDTTQATAKDDLVRDTSGDVHIVQDFLRPCSRREAYQADITYGTNNEFGFDYLRDNLATTKEQVVQREHFFSVVDEIDSILIDEARTPLIISSSTKENQALYPKCKDVVAELMPETDYTMDEKLRTISLTESGIERVEALLGVANLYDNEGSKLLHYVETAVRARALYHKDKEYVVMGGEVIIVDQSTGRMMPGRRFSYGLHQALEAKEGVTIKEETRTVASVTYQNYFKLYTHLAGMTGTAMTSKEEFYAVYKLDVVSIPTHKKIARADAEDLIYQSEHEKLHAVAQVVKACYASGQPVLVGTASIEKNELVSAYLTKEGVLHKVLNAKNHEQEGEIIANAGKKRSVVIATNMAGRGVDIKLGGEKATEAERQEVLDAGGLLVIGTERHESRRIDNQLRGRAGRQGDPGQTQFFVSLDDELMRIFGSDSLKSMMQRLGVPENEPIRHPFISRGLESAQKKIEGHHFDGRKSTLEYDTVLHTQRRSLYQIRQAILMGDASEVSSVVLDAFGTPETRGHIKELEEQAGVSVVGNLVRQISLGVMDMYWIRHLEMMDQVRSSVSLRAYGQREPIIEYKKEGLHLFQQLQIGQTKDIQERILSIVLQQSDTEPQQEVNA